MLKFWKNKPDDLASMQTSPRPNPLTQAGEGGNQATLADSSPITAAPATSAKSSWRERLAGSVFNRDIRDLFARHPKLDDALLDELETTLIGADVGVVASTELVESLRQRMGKREFADAGALLACLRAELIALLVPISVPL